MAFRRVDRGAGNPTRDYFGEWEMLEPQMSRETKTAIQHAYFRHIVGLTPDETKKLLDEFPQALKTVIGPDHEAKIPETILGRPIVFKYDAPAFWQEVLPLLPMKYSQQELDYMNREWGTTFWLGMAVAGFKQVEPRKEQPKQ